MSTFAFRGDEEHGIPRKARVRVESLPDRLPVFTGVVTDAVYLELDPGKYVASVVRCSPKDQARIDDCSYVMEFYHDLGDDPVQAKKVWQELQSMQPRLARVINTSEGPRWRCKLRATGCEFEGTSRLSALIHEVTDHLGIPRAQFLSNPTGKEVRTAMKKGVDLAAQVTQNEGQPQRATVFGPEVEQEAADIAAAEQES